MSRAASMLITFIAQLYGGAVRTFIQVPFSLRLANAIVSYAKYLFQAVWPSGLAVYYPFSVRVCGRGNLYARLRY